MANEKHTEEPSREQCTTPHNVGNNKHIFFIEAGDEISSTQSNSMDLPDVRDKG